VISDKKTAKSISDLMLDCGRRIDDSINAVNENCTPEEFQAYRRAAGKVMGSILIEVLNPLYEAHPDIKPSEMK